jgi:hypothetical protein
LEARASGYAAGAFAGAQGGDGVCDVPFTPDRRRPVVGGPRECLRDGGGGRGGASLAVIGGPRGFRGRLGGEPTVTPPAATGRGVEVHAMDEALVAGAIGWQRQRDGGT